MTVAAAWMLVALGRGEPSCLRGVGRTLLSGVACAAVAAAVGAALSAALPRQGIAASVGVAAVVGVVTAGVFAGLAARFDRATLLLVLRRRADAR
jgi:hypothetical protein